MNYSPEILIDELKQLPSDEEIIILREKQFEFDDCTVTVNGLIHETYVYDEGDAWTPPYAWLTGRVAELDEVIISYPDDEVWLNGKEINEIEKGLRL